MQFSRLVLVTMACLLVFADAGLEDPPDQVADLGLVHAVIPVTMRGITGRFWWSPIRSLPFQPGFRVGNPPFQKSSSIFDVTTGGRGDFYTRDSNTPPEILASACVLLFMSIQGVALPLWGGISREGKMVGFLHSPLNRGVPCSRLVCGNAGIEAMSPMAGLAFNSVRNSVAKSVVLFRRVLLLLAFAGYHALMIRELRFVLDVNDDSFSHLDDLRRADMTDSEFRFAMILYVQGMAASAFDSIFLRSLRTLWTGRFQNCLFNECRFAAAISRIAPLCTGVLVRNEGKNMQFGLSRQFSEEAFVSPTTNRVFAADENDAIDFEESSLRVIRDCVDGDWSGFTPPEFGDTEIPEMKSFIRLDDSMNVIRNASEAANEIQDSNMAMMVLFGGAFRPVFGVFVEKTRHETGTRKSDFCRFFKDLDSCAFDRLEGQQTVGEIEDQTTIEKKIADLTPLIEIVREPHGSEPVKSIFNVISASQAAFVNRNQFRVHKMTATDPRDSFIISTRAQIRWARDNSRGSAKAKASPPTLGPA